MSKKQVCPISFQTAQTVASWMFLLFADIFCRYRRTFVHLKIQLSQLSPPEQANFLYTIQHLSKPTVYLEMNWF